MELNSKVPHQVWMFNAFEDFQLIRRFFDCFVIVWLKSDLGKKKKKEKGGDLTLHADIIICLFLNPLNWSCRTHLLHSH